MFLIFIIPEVIYLASYIVTLGDQVSGEKRQINDYLKNSNLYTPNSVCLLLRHMLHNPPVHTLAQEYYLNRHNKSNETSDLTETHYPLFPTLLASQIRKTTRAQVMLICTFFKQTPILKLFLAIYILLKSLEHIFS